MTAVAGCQDITRHEAHCAHQRAPAVTRWRAADGCSGRMCPACRTAHRLDAWPDIIDRLAGPPDGLDRLEVLEVLNGPAPTPSDLERP